MRPPLAVRTALMTDRSMLGNASFRMCSFFSVSDTGRGGFGGGASSEAGWFGVPALAVVVLLASSPRMPVSCRSSSSISSGRAVVGDSGETGRWARREEFWPVPS